MAMDPIAPQLNIDTPELVAIEMPVAGIGSRFIAILIDSLILVAAVVVLGIGAALILPGLRILGGISANWAMGIILVLLFLLQWGYFALFEGFGNGKTPGKRAARIRVMHRSGRAASIVEALGRNLVRVIDYLPGMYAVGVVAMFLSRDHQRLGDMVAGTLVVRDREVESPHWGEMGSRTITGPMFAASAGAPAVAPHLRVALSAAGVARLSAADLQVLEGFFARRLDMDLRTRGDLAGRIAAALSAKSGLVIPDGVSTETFLEAVAHQLRDVGRMGT
jgi:uncharacterized RDD family membrane protein YckC